MTEKKKQRGASLPTGQSGQQTDQPTLQQMRLMRVLSIRGLARAAGIQPSTITFIERGVSAPRMDTIRALAQALDCDPHDIAWPGDPFAPLAKR